MFNTLILAAAVSAVSIQSAEHATAVEAITTVVPQYDLDFILADNDEPHPVSLA